MNPKPKHLPPPPAYKFLARNLGFQNDHTAIFKKVSLKRLYLRKLLDRREPFSFKETCYRPYKNNKLFKTLRQVQIPSFNQSHVYEALKNCKNVNIIILNLTTEDAKIEKTAHFAKRLPSTIKIISLEVLEFGGKTAKKDFCVLAKSIRYLSKLESIHRSCLFSHERKVNNVSKELGIYSKTASRLKNLKEVTYCVQGTDNLGFQRATRKGNTFPGITGLDVSLSIEHSINHHQFDPTKDYDLQDFSTMTEDQKQFYLLLQEEIRKKDRDEDPIPNFDFLNDERFRTGDRDFLVSCIMHEEMEPFFRFELFPNLKKLRLSQEVLLYSLGSFVVNGFAALKNLQCLHIDISERPHGTGYIFKGLLKLPLLKEFSLSINFLKKADWAFLQEFLKSQNDLISLALRVGDVVASKSRYLQQNAILQNITQDLENKRSLKSLSLRFRSCSLEAISRGISHLSMINQLHSLLFEGIDDTVFSKEKPWRRIGGLCDFIKNQKNSLKVLGVYLPFVLEENVVAHIAEAISKLALLREIDWFINPNLFGGVKHFQHCFRQILPSGVPSSSIIKPKASKQFNPNLAKYLKRLENLEKFHFIFDIVDSNVTTWAQDVVKALPSLKKLRKIRISSFSIDKIESVESEFMKILPELDHVREITFPAFKTVEILHFIGFVLSSNPILENMINERNKKEALRCDFMF